MMLRARFMAVAGCLVLAVVPVFAQTVADPSPQQRQEEGMRLQARRAALEQTFQQDMAVCYQQFDVTRCRHVARDKRIEASTALRQEELAYNARERRIAAEEAQRRTEDKQRDALLKAQDAAAIDAGAPDPSNRLSDAAQPQRNVNSQRAAYEQKQREAAERRSNLEKRLRERDKPPAAPLPVPEVAK